MTIKVTYNITDVYMTQSVSPVYINVSYAEGGSGGGAVWGAITGTLSDQTDLQNALNAKLDESTIDGGAEGQILVKNSATDFDFAWINNYAKYLATNVRNQTGSTIGAFQVVYISGATGNKPLISLADADTEATSSKTYGVTATSIANNGTGDVVTVGELSGIDTSAFTEGDSLWLSSTAGGVVTSPPAEPAHAVFIGYVVRSHPTLGVIDVAIANGYELNELHGVQITTPTDNQGLFYNATSTLWENKSITTALGYTPVPTTRNITINGVTYDLSADRTYTISTGISGSGASGQVTYWTGASAVSGSNNLFWDASNNRLGIGTNAPAAPLDVRTTSGFDSAILKSQYTATVYIGNDNTWGHFATAVGGTGTRVAIATQGIRFRINNTDRATFGQTGNLMLADNVPTDNGQRLQVIGDTLLRGSGATSATTALTVQNSSSTNLFTVRNDGLSRFGGNVEMRLDTNGDSKLSIINNTSGTSARARLDLYNNLLSGYIFTFGFNSALTTAYKILNSGDGFIYLNAPNDIAILNDYISGSIKFAAGGASTAHLTIKSNGRINMSSLPTSSTGLVAGDLWNDAGTVKIV